MHAHGIAFTSQTMGGAIGIAISSAVLSTTGTFWMVFVVTGGITFAVLMIGWFSIERHTVAQESLGTTNSI